MSFLAAALLGYALGSIPFGLLLTRWAGLGDIRAIGSGNIGATNVLRTGKKGLAALTLLLDGGKGAAAVLIITAATHGPNPAAIAGLFAVLGHLFPVWLRFKGGKGVATGLAVLLAFSFPVGLAACALWLIYAVWKKISSLAALMAFAMAPILALVIGIAFSKILVILLITVLIFIKHRANIARLRTGTEPRINLR
ncbi:MAG TPA: glycerol-3-phosphate 1-O-acyltransferase PlsY [Acidiphilium sp.]|nr:MAG: acyl-phosphate glycerol 3-phosphate acyltransferase [Acidiphilium sp. 21-60-14]OYV91975.1 MAG: acyl-phosphate glycerol 3-phosphate acyltransferase [Acidiphilium sp. 37-60-79]OZB39190.1 MAG: acyl-phosphate glycerol 3-phosphate acyltransferase [Acidiphilium sp. 34-60-192]HQT88400.1 glycerol-3-phosphate 1-O-acyltransferase PlsY [Acidiphilium sp.]HQU23928.1 glycerol-3-phosphate 1-O-acyltransferase PlsY [Acidiphilium sp.]